MSIWEIQVQMVTIWSSTARRHVSEEIDEIFKVLPNVFGIADDLLVVGYDADGKEHDETLWMVLQIYRQVTLKLNKDKCHFKYTSVPFFGEIILQHVVKPDTQKHTDGNAPQIRRNSKLFLE